MSLLFRILRATHARGTHHKLALDGLAKIGGPSAEEWRRLFLSHAERYLEGSKAPDNAFKDFQNHVLHVDDSLWGGAPAKAEEWYRTCVGHLAAGNWADAVYAAGVLSHYYTDPIHPFHTGQSDAESHVHSAVEWSISRSYDALRPLGDDAAADRDARPGFDRSWLADFVVAGARTSHVHYQDLITHYDFDVGVKEPERGLDQQAQVYVGGLIAYATSGWARVLERALAESQATPPVVDLTIQSVLSALKIPLKMMLKKLDDAADRRQVEAIYAELQATGGVEQTLGEAERMVRQLRPVAPPPVERPAVLERIPAAQAVPVASVPAVPMVPAPAVPIVRVPPAASAPGPAAASPAALAPRSPLLKAGDNVERAPTIGPKMADRLQRIGIVSVADLLAADPATVARQLTDQRLDAADIGDWQDQARLVMTIAGLRGTHAQLLVGAGYRSADAIAAAESDTLCARILAYAATTAGKRVLRDGTPPEIERIREWVATARSRHAA